MICRQGACRDVRPVRLPKVNGKRIHRPFEQNARTVRPHIRMHIQLLHPFTCQLSTETWGNARIVHLYFRSNKKQFRLERWTKVAFWWRNIMTGKAWKWVFQEVCSRTNNWFMSKIRGIFVKNRFRFLAFRKIFLPLQYQKTIGQLR